MDTYNFTRLPYEYENEYFYTYIITLYQKIFLMKLDSEYKEFEKIKQIFQCFLCEHKFTNAQLFYVKFTYYFITWNHSEMVYFSIHSEVTNII